MSSTITKFFASFLAYGVANKKKRFSAIGRFSEGLAPVKYSILNTDSSTIPDKYGFRLNTQPLTRLSKNVHEYVTMDYGD